MSRSSCAYFLLAAASLLAATGSAHAQQGPDPVSIVTADGVKLKGHYYVADKKCVATVIMLHPIGVGNSTKKDPEWKNLAESLQKAGYSVLTFDFRGHGDSTEIVDEKTFWNARVGNSQPNMANIKVKVRGDTIDVKDYIKQGSAYLPILVNDIAAARAYLERRNDKPGDCNTSSIIVVGVDQGATLGAIWINAEGSRYKYTPHPVNPNLPGTRAKNSEGSDIIGAVFLSITPNLDKQRPVSISAILRGPCKERYMAAAFISGNEDAKFAQTLVKNLTVPKNKKYDFIAANERDTKLTGMKLLTKGLKTEIDITEYLGTVVEDRKAEWSEREFDKSVYVWQTPGNPQMIPAKKKGEKTLVFEDYSKFIPQK
jgi:hypothetical protein